MTTDPAELLTPQGQELLARLAESQDAGLSPLALAERLRRDYPAGLVAAATAQQELRQAARAKFSRADAMLFTRAGYEQASSEAIAAHRARRLQGKARIADLCCGIGGDLTALSAVADVVAVDRDAVHARLARHNAAVYGHSERVTAIVSDVRDIRLAGQRLDAVFVDPARRSGPRHRVGRHRPPVPGRGLRAAARLVRRPGRPGTGGGGQGRPRAAGRGGTGRLGGRVHRRGPRPQGSRALVPGPGGAARAARPSCSATRPAPLTTRSR